MFDKNNDYILKEYYSAILTVSIECLFLHIMEYKDYLIYLPKCVATCQQRLLHRINVTQCNALNLTLQLSRNDI